MSAPSIFRVKWTNIMLKSGGQKIPIPSWSISVTLLKLNVCCALSVQKVYSPFFFVEKTIQGGHYLDMLKLWLLPQLEQECPAWSFNKTVTPPPPIFIMTSEDWAQHQTFDQMDWTCWWWRWRNSLLASTFPRPHTPWLLSLGLCQRPGVQATPSTEQPWSKSAHHSSHRNSWPSDATTYLGKNRLQVWFVSCYQWSSHWTSVRYYNKIF